MLAAPPLEKSPIKVPNLKPLAFLPPTHEHVKGFLSKCTVLKVDFVVWKRVRMCAFFSPDILQAEAVKGLMCKYYPVCYLL